MAKTKLDHEASCSSTAAAAADDAAGSGASSSSSSSSAAPPSDSAEAPSSQRRPVLPVTALRDKIVEKIRENRVTLIVGDTGCGKSSQVPQFLLEENLEPILCTQPRRFAVVAIAKMVAKSRGCEVGDEVGYHIGHSNVTAPRSRIVFKTAGVLLEQMRDKGLAALKYKVIILDEVHERSVESDLVLACVKLFMMRNKDLRVVLMSATADISRYRDYFKDLGRGERVEVLAIPTSPQQMIFQRKISYLEQQIMDEDGAVILATNIAESSVTIPGVAFVIDSCRSLSVFWDHNRKRDSAELVWVSKSQAEQRKGRTGRTCDGQIYRLVTRTFYNSMNEHEYPAILRLSLRQQVLMICCAESKAINDPRVLLKKVLDPPNPTVIEDSLNLLIHINALEKAVSHRGRHEPTFYGRLLDSLSLSFDASVVALKFGEIGLVQEGILIAILMDVQPWPIIQPFGDQSLFMEYLDGYFGGDAEIGKKENVFMGNLCAFQFWQHVFKDKHRLEHLKQILNVNESKASPSLFLKLEEEWCYNHNLVQTALHNISEICKQHYYACDKFHGMPPKWRLFQDFLGHRKIQKPLDFGITVPENKLNFKISGNKITVFTLEPSLVTSKTRDSFYKILDRDVRFPYFSSSQTKKNAKMSLFYINANKKDPGISVFLCQSKQSLHEIPLSFSTDEDVLSTIHKFRPKFLDKTNGLATYRGAHGFMHTCLLQAELVGDVDALKMDDEDSSSDTERRKCRCLPFVSPPDFGASDIADELAKLIKEIRVQFTEENALNGGEISTGIVRQSSGGTLCKFYVNGLCSKGYLCSFSHSSQAKAPPCKFFFTFQGCRNGDSCFYSHDGGPHSSYTKTVCLREETSCAHTFLNLLPASGTGCILIFNDRYLKFSTNLSMQYDPSNIIVVTSNSDIYGVDASSTGITLVQGMSDVHPSSFILDTQGKLSVPWSKLKCILWFADIVPNGAEDHDRHLQRFFEYLAIRLLAEAFYDVCVVIIMNNNKFAEAQVEKLGRECFFLLTRSFPFDETSLGKFTEDLAVPRPMQASFPACYVFEMHPPSVLQFGDYATALRQGLYRSK